MFSDHYRPVESHFLLRVIMSYFQLLYFSTKFYPYAFAWGFIASFAMDDFVIRILGVYWGPMEWAITQIQISQFHGFPTLAPLMIYSVLMSFGCIELTRLVEKYITSVTTQDGDSAAVPPPPPPPSPPIAVHPTRLFFTQDGCGFELSSSRLWKRR